MARPSFPVDAWRRAHAAGDPAAVHRLLQHPLLPAPADWPRVRVVPHRHDSLPETWAPALHAAAYRWPALVPLLLEAGADPDERSLQGDTALTVYGRLNAFTEHGSLDAMKELLAAATPWAEDAGGLTPGERWSRFIFAEAPAWTQAWCNAACDRLTQKPSREGWLRTLASHAYIGADAPSWKRLLERAPEGTHEPELWTAWHHDRGFSLLEWALVGNLLTEKDAHRASSRSAEFLTWLSAQAWAPEERAAAALLLPQLPAPADPLSAWQRWDTRLSPFLSTNDYIGSAASWPDMARRCWPSGVDPATADAWCHAMAGVFERASEPPSRKRTDAAASLVAVLPVPAGSVGLCEGARRLWAHWTEFEREVPAGATAAWGSALEALSLHRELPFEPSADARRPRL